MFFKQYPNYNFYSPPMFKSDSCRSEYLDPFNCTSYPRSERFDPFYRNFHQPTYRRNKPVHRHSSQIRQRKQPEYDGKYLEAIVKIQRAFRQYRIQKQNKAAKIIQSFFRDIINKKQALVKVERLKFLRDLRDQSLKIKEKYSNSNFNVFKLPLTFDENGKLSFSMNRDLLSYEDELLKLMLKIDSVVSEGDEFIRDRRKSVIHQVQGYLNQIDEYKTSQLEKKVEDKNDEIMEEYDWTDEVKYLDIDNDCSMGDAESIFEDAVSEFEVENILEDSLDLFK